MYIVNSNFTIAKPIGELSEQKISALKSELANEFPEFIQKNQQTVIFRRGVTGIFIQNQITFITQGDESEFNIEKITETLIKVNNLLSLSDNGLVALKFEGIKNTNKNIMEVSSKYVNNIAQNLGAYGVGYRFFIKNEKFHGDVKVEPFIRDHQQMFYEVTLETNVQKPLSELESYFKDMFQFGTEIVETQTEDIF